MRSNFKAGVLGIGLLLSTAPALHAVRSTSPNSKAKASRSLGLMKQYASAIKTKRAQHIQSGVEALTWPNLVSEALSGNSSLVEARLLLKQGKAQVNIDDAGFMPNISVAASINRGGGRQFVDGSSVNTCLLYTSPSPRDRQKSRM